MNSAVTDAVPAMTASGACSPNRKAAAASPPVALVRAADRAAAPVREYGQAAVAGGLEQRDDAGPDRRAEVRRDDRGR